jgi:hypothetical protein
MFLMIHCVTVWQTHRPLAGITQAREIIMIAKTLFQSFFPKPMHYGLLLVLFLFAALTAPNWARTLKRAPTTGEVVGTVAGLNGSAAMVTLGNDGFLRTAKTDAVGKFEFKQVPQGKYFLKAEAKGFAFGPAKEVLLDSSTASNEGPGRKPPRVSAALEAQGVDGNRFSYHWQADVSRSGYETSTNVVVPPVIKFLDNEVSTPDFSAATTLRNDYGIILGDEQIAWSLEHASRLLLTLKSIPQNQTVKPSKWVLVDSHIAGDIHIERSAAGDTVTLSTAAMVYANPKMVLLDGVKGRFFSKRLHHALVRFITDNGNNEAAIGTILRERFGVSVEVPNFSQLTASTTREDSGRFTRFRPTELLEIINMFEEMPSGFHVAKGLTYLVRRDFGRIHPLGNIVAKAWTQAGYIEFTDAAFVNLTLTHRIIVHEKSHFLWAHLFGDKIKDGWIRVGAWRRDASVPSGWVTGKTSEFVSAYAHQHNPDEDMAESLAVYILNPNLLKSRSLAKFEFIRINIMHGDVFISDIRSDLQFDVLNLLPDYDYPGKIKRIDLVVDGAPEDDKIVSIEMELDFVEGKQGGAQGAAMTLQNESGAFVHAQFYPKNGNPYVLSSRFTLSKYTKSGFWSNFQTRVYDATGNTRYEGKPDFGWQMWINNPLETRGLPEYVPRSLAVTKLPSVLVDGRVVQKLAVTWRVNESGPINEFGDVMAVLRTTDRGHVFGGSGRYDHASKTATVEFSITEFHPSGEYWVSWLSTRDVAGNRAASSFFDDTADSEPATRFTLNTTNPDLDAPELDLNRITISAKPVKPLAPDGATLVNLVFYLKEEKSGLQQASFNLRNPQGTSFQFTYYPANPENKPAAGDPAGWVRHEYQIMLPVGSAPGRWGLESSFLFDRILNSRSYSFVETLHFEIVP